MFSHFVQALRLGLSFKEELCKYGEGIINVKEMAEKLMKDTVKAEKGRLPGICSLDWEHSLSSVFVEVDTPLVKDTNLLSRLDHFYQTFLFFTYLDLCLDTGTIWYAKHCRIDHSSIWGS